MSMFDSVRFVPEIGSTSLGQIGPAIPRGDMPGDGQRLADANAAIQRVRDLHTGYEGYQCDGCCEEWPCQTIKALDGAE